MAQPFGRAVISNLFQVAGCKCEGDTFGQYCERSRDPCDEQCFPGVQCHPGMGCGACPPSMTGDGRHCAGELGAGPQQEEVLGQVTTQGQRQPKANNCSSFPSQSLECSPGEARGRMAWKGDRSWHGAEGEESVQAAGGPGQSSSEALVEKTQSRRLKLREEVQRTGASWGPWAPQGSSETPGPGALQFTGQGVFLLNPLPLVLGATAVTMKEITRRLPLEPPKVTK